MEPNNFGTNTNANLDSNGESKTLRSLLTQRQGKGMDEAEVRNLLQWVLPQLIHLHQKGGAHSNLTLDSIVFQNGRITLLPLNSPMPSPTISQDLNSLGAIAVELLTAQHFNSCINASGQLDWAKLSSISAPMQNYLYCLLATPPDQFASASDALQSLQSHDALTKQETNSCPTVSKPSRLSKSLRQLQPWQWGVMGSTAIGIGLIAGIGTGKITIPGINLGSLPGITAIQSNFQSESVGLFPVEVDGLYGYIDRDGEMVINPQFDDALAFTEGLAPVQVGDRWGYINHSGDTVISPQFNEAESFSEELAAVLVGDRWGYIDPTGNMIINPQFNNVESFSEGLAAVLVGNRYGYIDPIGDMVIDPQFDKIRSFSEGLAAVQVSGRWGYVNLEGNIVTNPQFDSIGDFSEGLAAACIDERCGYVDPFGTMVINPRFGGHGEFSEGLAPVRIGRRLGVDLWGFINQNGELVIDHQYVWTWGFSEGLAAVQVDGQWGYINQTGDMVINPQFYDAGSFSEGLARVARQGDRYGYIDSTGSFVWEYTSSPPPIQSEAKAYTGTMNRAQQAFYIEHRRFTPNLDELGIGIASDTNNYRYDIHQIRQDRVWMTAIPRRNDLPSYVGIVGVVLQGSNEHTVAVLCETDEPSMTPPLPSQSSAGVPECPAGTHRL